METSTTHSGRLEVFINGEWGTVCDDGWDINDAHVACRELGYSYALSYQCCARYGRGSGRIWLDNVDCSGGESSLLNCSHNGIGVLRRCNHWEDVGVACYRPGTVWMNSLMYSMCSILCCKLLFLQCIHRSAAVGGWKGNQHYPLRTTGGVHQWRMGHCV